MLQSPYAPSALRASLSSGSNVSTTGVLSTAQRDAFEATVAFLAGIGLFLSFIVSNVFVVMDMCCGGLQVKGDIVPSPLSLLELSWLQMLMLFILSSMIVVACGVVLMRYDLPIAAFAMRMVPVILIVTLAGQALRKTGGIRRYVGYVYLVIGSLMTGVALMYFISTGMNQMDYQSAPILHSVLLQGGLILAIASVLEMDRR